MATKQEDHDHELSDHARRWLRRVRGKKAQRTYEVRRTDIKKFEQWLRNNDKGTIEDVDALDIEDHIFGMEEQGYAPETIRVRYDSLSLFYRALAGKFDVIDQSPFDLLDRDEFSQLMQGTKKKQVTKDDITYTTPEQVELMTEHVGDPALRNELMIRLMFSTGLRQSEIIDIELRDIDRENRAIKVNAKKTHQNRTVFYHESLDFLLNQWLDGGYRDSSMYANESPYLFLSMRAGQFHDKKPTKIVGQAAENAGIQEVLYQDARGYDRHKISSHSLRHGFGVQAVKSGMNVREIQKLMGHKNLDMTMVYLDLASTDVRDSYRTNYTPYPIDR